MTHLNDISKVYMETVAKPDFLDLDKDGNKKEPMKKAAVEAPKERLKTDRDGYRVPKKDADAARERLLAKARAKRAKMSEALDPVGKEDADVDNDGKKNTKSDKYLLNRRKAIGKAMKEGTSKDIEVPSKDLVKLAKKAAKRIDTNVSGDVNKKDKTMGDYGEFVPTPDGRKVTTSFKEGYSNWRDDLREVVGETGEEQKQVKEKNVKNTIKINPKISEEVTILESTEMDEVDLAAYTVYDELLQEGFDVYDVEDAIEYAIIEAKVTYGHDTEKPHEKDTSAGRMIKAVGRLARQKLKSAGKKAKLKSAQAQVAAYNKGREVKQKAGDKVRGAKAGIKGKIKRAAQKVVDRMSEETAMQMSPAEVALQKKKATVDQQIAMKRKQALTKIKKQPEQEVQKEGLSIDDQMRISREAAAKRKPYKDGDHQRARAAQMKNAAKNAKKDTRTDAQKMTDATGPRPGSRYRGD
jgi:CDGSH-type Zn-finger protein